ncbi:MAG: hypothetical protein IPJ82_22695 [Lewinellaceae bacterium]|nr:hypothetical protein [Lewinellaceae bacterium]
MKYAQGLAKKKDGNSEYILGYFMAHEFLHQLLMKAKSGTYDGHTDEKNPYGIPVTAEPNLNKSGPFVEDQVPSDWSKELRPAESIIEIHKNIINDYLKNLKW